MKGSKHFSQLSFSGPQRGTDVEVLRSISIFFNKIKVIFDL
jgi:hypothetical protein